MHSFQNSFYLAVFSGGMRSPLDAGKNRHSQRCPHTRKCAGAGGARSFQDLSASRRGHCLDRMPFLERRDEYSARRISPGDLTHLSLRIVSWSSQLGDSTFGIAFLSEEGVGVYSDVFYPLVEKLHSDFGASLSRVLGHVMAHEIGHLLLGLRSHSALGIMQPHWQEEALRRIGMGTLLFTAEQARSMRERLLAKSEDSMATAARPATQLAEASQH